VPRSEGLTPEQQRFVDEYLIDLNGTQAYRRAYPGVAYTTARTESSRLLANPNIRREVEAAKAARSERTQITADRVLEAVALVAFADPLDLTDADGRPRPLRQIPPELRAAIAGVKVRRETVRRVTLGDDSTETKSEVVEYKLNDRLGALEKLFRHLGLSQEIPPLDALLAALPEDLRPAVRAALGAAVSGGDDPPGAGGRRRRGKRA
jgi:phage terminase small subunit